MRWGKDQLNTVKRVADGIGIPYQTYIKHVVLKQSLQDLDQLEKMKTLQQLNISFPTLLLYLALLLFFPFCKHKQWRYSLSSGLEQTA